MSLTRPRSLAIALGTSALALAACGLSGPERSAPPDVPDAVTAAAPARAAAASFVVAITIDGFNPTSLARIGPARASGFTRMIRYGASTLNARTAYERTETMPDHSSVFTGRRIDKAPAHHVVFNDDDARTDIHTVAGEYVTSMFDIVHDRGRRTYFYAGKEKFAFWDRSWDATRGAPDVVGRDQGRDKISRYRFGTTQQITDALVSSLQTAPPALSYLHVPLPDKAGHAYGFMSKRYLAAVEDSARVVARVLDTVNRSDVLRGHTTVVLTADHGGGGGATSHSDPTLLRNYRVPFLVWGAGVTRGADLYDLNPARVDPGTGRPGYGAYPPVRNLDLASLVTTLLGYPAVPGAVPGTSPLQVS